jgi:hypothetical protein
MTSFDSAYLALVHLDCYAEGMTDPKPKLRWFQFSLLTLLAVVTFCAISYCWYAVQRPNAREQPKPEVLATIEKLGGQVRLRSRMFGERPIVAVYLSESKITDFDLDNLINGLNRLIYFDLRSWTEINDHEPPPGFRPFNRFELYLRDTQISDAGLKHSREVAHLELLDLTGTQVTDAGVKKLQQTLPKCKIVR